MQMGFSTEKVCMANLNIPVLSGSRLPNLSTSSRELCWVKRKAPKLCTNLNPTVTDRKQSLFLKVERSFAQFMLYPMG